MPQDINITSLNSKKTPKKSGIRKVSRELATARSKFKEALMKARMDLLYSSQTKKKNFPNQKAHTIKENDSVLQLPVPDIAHMSNLTPEKLSVNTENVTLNSEQRLPKKEQ